MVWNFRPIVCVGISRPQSLIIGKVTPSKRSEFNRNIWGEEYGMIHNSFQREQVIYIPLLVDSQVNKVGLTFAAQTGL